MIKELSTFLANDAGRLELVSDVLDADVAARPAAEDARAHAFVAENRIAQQTEIEVFEGIREGAHTAGTRMLEDDFRELIGLRHVRPPLLLNQGIPGASPASGDCF